MAHSAFAGAVGFVGERRMVLRFRRLAGVDGGVEVE